RPRHPGRSDCLALRRRQAARSRRRDRPVHRDDDGRRRGRARRRRRGDQRFAPSGGRRVTVIRRQPVPDVGATDVKALEPLLVELHPRQSYRMTQGVLALAHELEQMLAKITGMDHVTLQPAAGAQSEFTALLMFKAYHAKRGEAALRRRIIVPDSAHGTNPASAAMCGYQVTTVKSDARGNVDLDALKAALGPDVAGFMLTNPNTLGLFEERVREVCDAVHAAGALVYGDGANMNALLGIARPGDLGFDCVHINVHKTFS